MILRLIIIYFNLIGLLTVQALEAWRPGTISAVVSPTWLWLVSALLIGLALMFTGKTQNTNPPSGTN